MFQNVIIEYGKVKTNLIHDQFDRTKWTF